ncbi:Zn finger-containing GTPase- Activating Protein for ARF, partial [Ascosphaera aggregata]
MRMSSCKIEYLVILMDDEEKKARLSLCQAEILESLAKEEEQMKGQLVKGLTDEPEAYPKFHPEFGRFMLEATPGAPWGINLTDLLKVESNMKWRRDIARKHLPANAYPITLTTFPRLGTKDDFSRPYFPPSGPALRSQFVPDEIANPHIRFPTLAANIRWRRGRKVELNVPVYRDRNTPWPFHDPTVNYDLHNWAEDDDVRNGAAKEGCVYMDAMAFGMGSCCLQITFQCKNIHEARNLYDQLLPLGPIMLALTAGTPIYKGFLVDTDVRWNQIGASVDCRTKEELGEKPLKNDRWRIPKSRYASNSTYISESPELRPEYQDPDLVFDEKIKKKLIDGGMDDVLATHFAHLFIRDPIVIFEEDLEELDLNKSDHFENLQSTNWQHIRFKPPPAENDSIGWRVEFRPMEIQMTDFENAAFSVFMVLITRAILSFDLNFYIPIQKVTENMSTAHARNAVLDQKFWFRRDPFPKRRRRDKSSPKSASGSTVTTSTFTTTCSSFSSSSSSGSASPQSYRSGSPTTSTTPPPPQQPRSHTLTPVENEYDLTTVNEVINGSSDPDGFPGLIPLVDSYLNSMNIDVETRCHLASYLNLIRKRADGRLWTNAKWIRNFVDKCPDYKGDSQVNEEVTYKLMKAVEEITEFEGKDRRYATKEKSPVEHYGV